MANLSLQKFRPGSSILPGSSFRPESGKQAAELQIDTQKRLPTLALFPNGLPSGYLDPTGNLALNQFPENQLNQKPFTMLVEEGTFISNHKGEQLNSKNEWHQAKIIRTATNVIQGGADVLRRQGGRDHAGGGGGRAGGHRPQGGA